MMTTGKPCTKCGEVKPPAAFYLKLAGDPNGPRRASCKACDKAEGDRRRAEGESVMSELIRVGMSNYDLLSEKARAAVFTEEPIDPAIIAACTARRKKREAQERRVARKLEREMELGLRPMRFSRQDTFA